MSDEETGMSINDAAEMFSETFVEAAEENGAIDSSTADDYKAALSRNRQPDDVKKVVEDVTDKIFSNRSTEGEDDE